MLLARHHCFSSLVFFELSGTFYEFLLRTHSSTIIASPATAVILAAMIMLDRVPSVSSEIKISSNTL